MMPLPPPLLISFAIGIAALVIAIPIMAKKVKQNKHAWLWHFGREDDVSFISGDNLADLVTFPAGGYVIRPNAVINMRYGRPFSDNAPVEWRRKSRPVSLVRSGDSAGMVISPGGQVFVQPLTGPEHDEREDMAAEIAVSEAAIRASGADFVAKALAATAAVMGIPVIGVVLAVVWKGVAS